MLSKLALSALSLIGFGGEKPTLKSALEKYIPIHDIQAIIAGYMSSYEPTNKIDYPDVHQHQFSADSRYFISLNTEDYSTTQQAATLINKLVYGDSNRVLCEGTLVAYDMHTNKYNVNALSERTQPESRHIIHESNQSDIAITSKDDFQYHISIVDAKTGKTKKKISLEKHGQTFSAIVAKYSSDGKIFAIWELDQKRMSLFDTESYNLIRSFQTKERRVPRYGVGDFKFSSDNSRLVTYSDTELSVWDVEMGTLIKNIQRSTLYSSAEVQLLNGHYTLHGHYVSGLREHWHIFLSGDYITIISEPVWRKNSVIVWDLTSNKPITQFRCADAKTYDAHAAYASDGSYIAIEEQVWGQVNISIWDILQGKIEHSFNISGEVTKLIFGQDNRTLVATVYNGDVYIFDIKQGICTQHMQQAAKRQVYGHSCHLSPDGRYLAIGHPTARDWRGNRQLQVFENQAIAFEQEAIQKRAAVAQQIIEAETSSSSSSSSSSGNHSKKRRRDVEIENEKKDKAQKK